MSEVTLPESNLSAWQWWEARRLRYNIGLVVSGILAFFAYAIVLFTFSDRIPDAEITVFTTLFQGVGYVFFIVIANIFYFSGWISEKLIRARNLESHRRMAYALGFWFSVALPWLIPISLAYFAIIHPELWQEMRL
jgi:magnesium-transporting ATPase (P-type)